MSDPTTDIKRSGVPILDDAFVVKVSPDGMRAILKAKAKDAPLPSAVALKEILTAIGITVGILDKPEPAGADSSFVVARGIPPIPGENAKIRFHVTPSVVRVPKMKEAGSDEVDYRELGGIVNVRQDQLLLEKVPLTAGTPGKTVLGEEAPARPGHDVKIKLGPGVREEEATANVYAMVNGKFIMADDKASVSAEHVIGGDVDLSTGNISFVGSSLVINGTVLPGFKVRCMGDVFVAKGVNDAEIVAGGMVTVLGGMVGEHAAVTSGGDIIIDFCENGPRLSTSGSVIFKDAAIQATVSAGGNVRATDGKGLIVGGTYVLGGSLWAKELGSDAEVITEIVVGLPPALEKKKQKLAEDQEVWPARMSETLKNISTLNKLKKESGGKLPPDKQLLLEKCNAFLPRVTEKVNSLTELEEEIKAEIERAADECVYVGGRLYPGVQITIGGARRVISQLDEGVVVRLGKKNREIVVMKMTEEERTAYVPL